VKAGRGDTEGFERGLDEVKSFGPVGEDNAGER
jgi:hypothetical protein